MKKKPERQQAFISGEHELKDLSKFVQQFINEVVLCITCGLPEILIHIEEKKVRGKCIACGSDNEMKITNEKFKRYVINHAPVSKSAFQGNEASEKNKNSKKLNLKKKIFNQKILLPEEQKRKLLKRMTMLNGFLILLKKQ